MKAFQLPPKTQAKLVKATPHKEFDRKNPPRQAISLKLRATLSLATLRQINPNLPDVFVRMRDDAHTQAQVEGVPPVLFELRAPELTLPISLDSEFTGYTVNVDRAMGDLELYGCKVGKIKVTEILLEGEHGMGVVEWSVGSDEKITPELVGAVCSMEGEDVWLGQKAPDKPDEVKAVAKARKHQREVEAAGQQRLDEGGGQQQSAGEAFAAAHGGSQGPREGAGGDDDSEGGNPDAGGAGEAVRGENWPFPQGGSELSDMERTRRAAAGEQPPQDATHEPLPKRRGKGNGAAATH